MIACPCCRATNDRGPACRRCKADLSMLFALAARRESLLAAARARLAGGEPAAALEAIAEAEAIRDGAEVRRLRAAAGLLNRDFTAALAWYSAAVNGKPA